MRINWKRNAFKELRNSPAVQADLKSRASRIAGAAGEGMETRPVETGNRARAVVVTATFKAARAEATRSALTSALDAGR